MTVSALIELLGASERGRFDQAYYHRLCSSFYSYLDGTGGVPGLNWYIAADHVLVEANDEVRLFKWISKIVDAGLAGERTKHSERWVVRGAVLEGTLGLKNVSRGWITSSDSSMLAELRSAVKSFSAAGIRVGYITAVPAAQEMTFTNVIWTGGQELPYLLFLDIKSANARLWNEERLRQLVLAANSATNYSKRIARYYVAAVINFLQNNARATSLQDIIEILDPIMLIEGMEMVGLVLASLAFSDEEVPDELAKSLITFPRTLKLATLLQEKHAVPIGLVKSEAVIKYLVAAHAVSGGSPSASRKSRK